jgi:short-chain Z-isoprenyl diphosphate synthase
MLRDLAYGLYSGKLRRELSGAAVPGHVGLIMDGNRRWARQLGLASPSLGHKYGAEHVEDVLSWCERAGIRNVTVFVCSAENLQRRGDAEIGFLMQVIEDVVASRLARPEGTWQVHTAGMLDVLPDSTARALKEAVEATRECATGAHVTLAIGYGGRQEVLDAIRALLYEQAAGGGTLTALAGSLTTGDIAGTCTQPVSPIPTWSSAPAVSSAYPASCSGRACIPNCTSATPTGPRSARSTSCEHCAATPPGKADAEPDAARRRPDPAYQRAGLSASSKPMADAKSAIGSADVSRIRVPRGHPDETATQAM